MNRHCSKTSMLMGGQIFPNCKVDIKRYEYSLKTLKFLIAEFSTETSSLTFLQEHFPVTPL